jgi:hypothetical protein
MHSTDLETPAPVLPAKDQYESAINRSEHLPQAKNISEMVLDAFNTSGESEKSASCAPLYARPWTPPTMIARMR